MHGGVAGGGDRPASEGEPVVTGPSLPPEIIAVLRRTAEETLTRHVALLDGRCSYCSATWLHTDTVHPCPPVRIAMTFLQVTGDA